MEKWLVKKREKWKRQKQRETREKRGIEEKQEQEQEPSWLAAEGGQRKEVSGG